MFVYTFISLNDSEKQAIEDIQHLVMHPIINRLDPKHRVIKIVRAKINLYPYQSEHMKRHIILISQQNTKYYYYQLIQIMVILNLRISNI